MARIPDAVVEEVTSRASILEVVGASVTLKRKGARWWGLCPFHQEKSPSFTVNAERNMYHCFGCGASGSSIGFLMQQQGLSFPESVRLLADRYGVEIPEEDDHDDGQARRKRAERERYFEATNFARDLYVGALWSGRFHEPLAYLESRGVDEATARAFGLGYAPEGWSTLLDRAAKQGIEGKSLEYAGLTLERSGVGGYYDRFRHRVMFPILSLSGQVLAFSGRALSAEERAKYINSPETDHYTKGRELYGLHVAHKGIRRAGYALLVEGNFDVVTLHARGFDMTCAPLGTAMTEAQARLLKRYTDRVVLMLDGDEAGRAAARKALRVLLSVDLTDVAFADLPAGTDPDDIVQQEGADGLRRYVEAAQPMLDVLLDEAIAPAAGRQNPSAKRTAAEAIGELLAPVQNELLLRTHIEQAARRLEIDAALLRDEVGRAIRGERRTQAPPPDEVRSAAVVEPLPPLSAFEATLVATLSEVPELLETVHRENAHLLLEHRALAEFLERVAARYVEGSGTGLREALEQDADPRLTTLLTSAIVSDMGLTVTTAQQAFDECLRGLKTRWIRAQQTEIAEALRVAERRGDVDGELELLERQHELQRWLSQIDPRMRAQPVLGERSEDSLRGSPPSNT